MSDMENMGAAPADIEGEPGFTIPGLGDGNPYTLGLDDGNEMADEAKPKPHPLEAVRVKPKADEPEAKKKPLPQPYELWHSPDGNAWATIKGLNYRVEGRDFRAWLTQKLVARDNEAPSRYTLEKSVNAYDARAKFDGFEHDLHRRSARVCSSVWLDLGDRTGRAIVIEPSGWQLVPAAPVKFWRPPTMRPLPEPLRDEANIGLLLDLMNITDANMLRMVQTWLSFSILPGMPYRCWRSEANPARQRRWAASSCATLLTRPARHCEACRGATTLWRPPRTMRSSLSTT
jgi:hypothetical protein